MAVNLDLGFAGLVVWILAMDCEQLMKSGIVFLAVCGLVGCGTLTSLSSTDDELARNLIKHKTHCDSTSRVYGGVSYNLCRLNSNQTGDYLNVLLGLYVLDTAVSAATDTLVLPFTLYRQVDQGNVQVAL